MDSQELSDSIVKDKVVREHYADVEPSRMWFTRLERPLLAYVSFRSGSRIGWTTHPVTIAANELVLTDGKKMIRARCGNRIEVQRPDPLPATTEVPPVPPPDVAMDTGLPPVVPPTETPVTPRREISTLVTDGGTQLIATGPIPGRGMPPSTPPILCCDIIQAPCCGTTPKPVTRVSEPSSLLLFGAGGFAVWLAGRKLMRK